MLDLQGNMVNGGDGTTLRRWKDLDNILELNCKIVFHNFPGSPRIVDSNRAGWISFLSIILLF